MLNFLFMFLLLVTAVFLILLVLVQRGRGGGLAGALGGMGGQSAFGTKAGDLFTRITIGVAAFWIILCASVVWWLNHSRNVMSSKFGQSGVEVSAPEGGDKAAPAGDKAAPAGDKAAPAGDKAVPAGDKAAAPATPATPAAPAGDSGKK